MWIRASTLTCVLLVSAQSLLAQSLEDRVASLETQVAELWLLHDRAYGSGTKVPAHLVGNEHLRWGYPGGECQVLINDWFITCHDNSKRIPQWVSYHLNAVLLAGSTKRSDDFRPDSELPEGERAELADYAGSGYDRGHMAPAAAFKRSEAAMSEAFKLSNMAPQTPSLNRVMWRLLEEDVRNRLRRFDLYRTFVWHVKLSVMLDTRPLTEPNHSILALERMDGYAFSIHTVLCLTEREAYASAAGVGICDLGLGGNDDVLWHNTWNI